MSLKVRDATMKDAQDVLLLLWCAVFTAAVLLTMFNVSLNPAVMTWLLPTTLPVLGALIAARIRLAQTPGDPRWRTEVDPTLYLVTLILSGLYLIVLGFVLIDRVEVFPRMERAGLLLGPLEGVLLGLLGYVFFFDPAERMARQPVVEGKGGDAT